jgi:hypothetical protein
MILKQKNEARNKRVDVIILLSDPTHYIIIIIIITPYKRLREKKKVHYKPMRGGTDASKGLVDLKITNGGKKNMS